MRPTVLELARRLEAVNGLNFRKVQVFASVMSNLNEWITGRRNRTLFDQASGDARRAAQCFQSLGANGALVCHGIRSQFYDVHEK
jgi:glutaredoxin-related protein